MGPYFYARCPPPVLLTHRNIRDLMVLLFMPMVVYMAGWFVEEFGGEQ